MKIINNKAAKTVSATGQTLGGGGRKAGNIIITANKHLHKPNKHQSLKLNKVNNEVDESEVHGIREM